MTRLLCTLLGLTLTATAALPAAAAEPRPLAPKVQLITTNAAHVLEDLEWVMSLTTPEEQKQHPVLVDYLEIFLIGVDRTKMLRMDPILTGEVERYRTAVPVLNFNQFRTRNLEPLGMNIRRIARTLYRLKMQEDVIGYMRFKDGYASFGEQKTDVPIDLVEPRSDVGHLLKAGYDAALDGRNGSEGIAERHGYFPAIRKQRLAELKQREDETAEEFNVRRVSADNSLDMEERLYAEAARLLLGLTIDRQQEQARMEIRVEPLADTDLKKEIDSYGQRASDFAAIPRGDDQSILSARINQPQDMLRQENLLGLSAAMRSRELAYTRTDDTYKGEAQEAMLAAVNMFFDLANEGVKTGLIDCFAEGQPTADGKYSLTAAARTSDGTKFIELLELLPKTGDVEVNLKVEETGGVQIHRTGIPELHRAWFEYFFGTQELYVGTEKDRVWLAAGAGALENLKAAIGVVTDKEADRGPADAPYMDIVMRPGPWLELRQFRRGTGGDEKLRKMAIEAFQPGDDRMTLLLKRVEEHVEGQLVGHRGTMRLLGKMFADFSKENLDEDE